MCVPAAVSLAAASVNTLGQSVVQTGINHIQTDGLLVHLTTGIPVKHKQHNTLRRRRRSRSKTVVLLHNRQEKMMMFNVSRRSTSTARGHILISSDKNCASILQYYTHNLTGNHDGCRSYRIRVTHCEKLTMFEGQRDIFWI